MSVPEGQSNQRLILHKSQAAGGIDSLSFCQLHEIEYNVVEIIIINNNTTTTTKSQTLFLKALHVSPYLILTTNLRGRLLLLSSPFYK